MHGLVSPPCIDGTLSILPTIYNFLLSYFQYSVYELANFNCKFKSQKPFTFTLTIVHLILQISIDSIAEYSRIRIK